jgi:hypothetical protein
MSRALSTQDVRRLTIRKPYHLINDLTSALTRDST